MKRVKVFKERESLLVQLFNKSETFVGLYNLGIIQMTFFLAVVLLQAIYSGGYEYLDHESKVFGGLGDWMRWFVLELVQLFVALLIHPTFMVWRQLRKLGILVDVIFALLYGIMSLVTMAMVWQATRTLQLAPIPRVVGTLENLRLVMKTYSFIRENVVKVIYPWNKDDEQGPPLWYKGQMESSVGSFRKYLYFLFAPTFLYRDRYPRLKRGISWWNVSIYLLQFLVLAYASKHLFELLLPISMRPEDLLRCFLGCLLLSVVASQVSSLTVLHAWQNFTAELTLFADRQFYTDWWNSESFPVFYRNWNVPVYDWLSAYVYQDLQVVIKNRGILAFIVFFLSSLIHDYHTYVAVGYFLPVLLLLFSGGGSIAFFTCPTKSDRVARVMTMAGFYLGVAIMLFINFTEFTARTQCPNMSHYYVTVHCLNLTTFSLK